jgi:hypothetical protein
MVSELNLISIVRTSFIECNIVYDVEILLLPPSSHTPHKAVNGGKTADGTGSDHYENLKITYLWCNY